VTAVRVRTRYPDDYAVSPDCQVGKHVACSGDAWDVVDDVPTACECDCHDDQLDREDTR
jgi:hypothetical protein